MPLGHRTIGERPEKELITGFVNRIAELSPQLVTFNGSGFDLPVLRYRAMIHAIPAIGLAARPLEGMLRVPSDGFANGDEWNRRVEFPIFGCGLAPETTIMNNCG
jgi:DNA polymerase elongation subunit (family B)